MLGEIEHEAPVVRGVVGDEQDANDVRAMLRALEQRAQPDARAFAARIVAERGLVAGDGFGDGVELLTLDVAELAEDLGLLRDALGPAGRSGEELGELLPHPRAAIERRQRARAVVGVTERLLDVAPRLDRLLGGLELLAEDGGDAHAVGALLIALVRGALELAALGERLDEGTPALGLLEQDDEAVERLGIVGRGLEPALPRPDGAVVLLQLGGETRCLAEHAPADLVLLLEDRETFEDVEAIGLPTGLLEERLDVTAGCEQRLVGDRRDREDAEKQLDRPGNVADLLGGHDAGVHQELDLERVVVARAREVVGRGHEHLGEALEAPDTRGELRELVAMRRDLGLEEHELDEVLHPVLVVAELRIDGGDLLVAADAFLDALDRLELDLEDAREIRLATGLRVTLPEQRGGALPDEASLRCHRQVRVASTFGRRRKRLAHLGGPRRDGEHALEEIGDVDRGEGRRRDRAAHRTRRRKRIALALGGQVRDEVLDDDDRARRVAELAEPQPGDTGALALRLFVRQLLDAIAEQRDELAVTAVALVETLERRGEPRVAGLQLEELLEVADGALRVVGEVLGDLRGLFEQLEATLLIGAGRGAVVEREEIVPALLRVVDQLEAIEGPRVVGLDLQQPLEDAHDPAAVLEPLLVERDRALPELDGLAFREILTEHLLVERGDGIGLRELARDGLGAIPEHGMTRQLLRRAHHQLVGLAALVDLGEQIEQALVLSEAHVGSGLTVANEALEDVDAHERIVDGVERLLEHLGGARRHLRIAEQLGGELERLRIVGSGFEDAGDALDGLAPAPRTTREDGCNLHVESIARIPLAGGAPCDERGERALHVTLREREARDGCERIEVVGLAVDHLLVEHERARRIAELGLLDRRPRGERTTSLLGLRVLDAELQQPAEVGGSLVARRHRLEQRVEPLVRGGTMRVAAGRRARVLGANVLEHRAIRERGIGDGRRGRGEHAGLGEREIGGRGTREPRRLGARGFGVARFGILRRAHRAHRAHRLADRVGEVLDGAGPNGERLELGEHLAIERRDGERAARRGESAGQVADAVGERAREVAEQRHALGVLARQLEERAGERGHAHVVAALLVELDELRGGGRITRVDLAQRHQQADRGGVVAHASRDVGGLTEALGGARHVAGAAIQHGEALETLHLLARIRGIAHAPLEHRANEIGVLDGGRDALHEIEIGGRQIGVLEQRLRMQRSALLLAVRAGHLGELGARTTGLFRRRGVREMRLEHVAEVFPGLGLRVELGQGGMRGLIGGIILQRALVSPDRGIGVHQLVALDGADAVEELLASCGLGTALQGRAVERHALLGVAGLAEQLVDAREELGGCGLVGERATQRGQRSADVARCGVLLAETLREREQIVRRDGMLAETLAEDGRALLVIGVAGEEIEATEPWADGLVALDGLGEAARDHVERLLARDRDRRVRRLFERDEAIVDDGGELGLDVEDAQETGDVVVAAVHRLEDRRGREAMLAGGQELLQRRAAGFFLGIDAERGAERLDGGVLIAGTCKIHETEASEDRGALLEGRELGVPHERARELGPLALRLEDRHPLRVDVARGAVRLDHLAPRLGGAVLILRLLREHLARAERELACLAATAAACGVGQARRT